MTMPPATRRGLEAAAVVALFALTGWQPVPFGNEVDYLGKARRFWDASWISGDFFLNSADAHAVFYALFGWVTLLLPMEPAAWVLRGLTWLAQGLAWFWLARVVSPATGSALLSAAILVAVNRWGAVAGEWVVRTTEAKPFAYALAWIAIAEAIQGRWGRSAAWLGASVALHPLVGGWIGLALLPVLIVRRREIESKPFAWGVAIGAVLALAGIAPALQGLSTDPEIARAAAAIQIHERLPHHLFAPATAWLSPAWLGWVILWLVAAIATRRHPAARLLHALAAVSLVVSLAAAVVVLLGQTTGLRFYPFRLADAAVPMALGFSAVLLLDKRPRWLLAATVLAVGLAAWPKVEELATSPWIPKSFRLGDGLPDRAERYADWLDLAAWARQETPPGTRFLSGRYDESLPWYFERGEIASWKHMPQDPAGVVEWWGRLTEAFGPPGRSPPGELPHAAGPERLDALVRRCGPFLYVVPADVTLDRPLLYRNRFYAVYDCR